MFPGLTKRWRPCSCSCRSDRFMTARVATMKGHMETEHGYEGKHAGVVKKLKGKG